MIHRETRIALSPITVLVGPNGGGKSALFDAVLNFSMLSRGSLKQAFGHYPYSYAATKCRHAAAFERVGFEVVMSRGREEPDRLKYTINYFQVGTAEQGNPNFEIGFERLERLPAEVLFDRNHPGGSPLVNATQRVMADFGILAAARKVSLDGQDDDISDDISVVSDCAKEIGRFNRFRLEPAELSSPSRVPELSGAPSPRLGYRGEDLASCLYYMNETDDPVLATVSNEVRTVLPEFESFEFNMVGADRVAFSMKFLTAGAASTPQGCPTAT